MHKILSSTILSLALAQGAYAQYPDQQQDQGGYPDQGYPDQGQDQGTQDQQGGQDQGAPAMQPQQESQQPPPQEWVEQPADDPVAAEPANSTGSGSFRLLATFDPGFAGGATLHIDGGGELEGDLDPTLGMRLQAQIPIGDLLFFGFNFGVDGYLADGSPSDADRLILIGLGAVFGFHYAIPLGSFTIEPTGGLAIDFAIATADDVTLEDSEFGFGLGFRAGANFWFTQLIGAQFNLGVQTHQIFASSGGTDVRLSLVQFRMGIGLIIRFGA